MFSFVFGLVLSPLNFILRLAGLGKAGQPPPSARAKAKAVAQKAAGTAPDKQRRSTKTKPKSSAMSGAAESAAQNGSPAPEDKSKLEQQATAKGELSYSYWAGKNATSSAPVPEPRKLTDEEKAELERQAQANGASAWNAAGTFEERGATPWAKERLRALVRALEPQGDVTVTDVNSVEGEANIFIVRGKKRCGFDLELQLAWKAVPQPGATEIRGHCKVVNFCSDDPDDLEVQPEVGHRQPERRADEEAALKKVRTVLKEQLGKVLAALLEELKQK